MRRFYLLGALCFVPSLALAQATPTPTPTPSPTPTPVPCQTVEDCVANGVVSTLASCISSTPACTVRDRDAFAASSEIIATRAVHQKKCDTKTFTHRLVCQVCFDSAKIPLDVRLDGKIFHGLLADAIKEINVQKAAKCGKIKKQ